MCSLGYFAVISPGAVSVRGCQYFTVGYDETELQFTGVRGRNTA